MMWIVIGFLAAALCIVLIAMHNAVPYNPAWEEDMLTQEELETLANELWETK